MEVVITQKETGLIQTEFPENMLNAAMQKSVEMKDLTPIALTVAAFTKALIEPIEYELNGYTIKVNKKAEL